MDPATNPPTPPLHPTTPVRATKKIRTDENNPNHNDAAAAGHGAKVTTSVQPSPPSKSGEILASPTQPGELVDRRQARVESNLDRQYAAALMKEDEATAKFEEAKMKEDEATAKFEEEMMGGINPEFTLCNPKYEVAGDFFGNGDKFATGSKGTTESKKITKLLPPGTITQYQVSHLTAVQCERKNYRLGYGGYEGNYSGTIRGELGFDDRGKCISTSKVNKDKMKMWVEEGKGAAKNFNNYAAEVPFQAYYGGDDNGVRLVKPDAISPSGWSNVDEQEFINEPTGAKAFEVKNRKCLDLLGKALKVSEKKKKDGRTESAGIVLAKKLKPNAKTVTGEHVICFDMERFHDNKTYKTLGPTHPLQKIAGYRFIITSEKKFTPDKIVSEVQGNTAEDDSKPTATAV
ncbi:hypothetical protein ACHAWC_005177 [Mediolabrus comicus]